MSRSTKKILYGIFWNGLVLLAIVAIYFVWFKPAPSCTDSVRNQNETGVDCGGSCVSCAAKQLSPLEVFEEPRAFSLTSGRTVLMGQVANPNATFGADQFSYEFVIYDRVGAVAERITGTGRLYPFETRYMSAFSVETAAAKIGTVSLEVSAPRWRPAGEMPRPDLQVLSGLSTTLAAGAVRVSGIVRNQGDMYVAKVRVIAILVDHSGNDLFPAQTVVSGLQGFRELPFAVQFPPDEGIAAAVDLSATRVIIQPE
ncbi:MAG: hypothetical protein Q7R54_02985 [bacterium]|nr:hypothetical protein [bacterium]